MSSPISNRYDLHVHSTFSDGELTPKELIVRAKEKGLLGISITDHDTVEAYPEALELGKKEGIVVGTGVEFSATFEGLSVHVLGYAFPYDAPSMRTLCLRHKARRTKRNRAMLEKLRAHHISIDESDLIGHQIGRPHIADALIKKGVVRNYKEAFARFLSESAPCYVQGEIISVEETIAAIHAGGGKAFLAHPQLLPQRKKWILRLLSLPFDGLEGHYARFDKDAEQKWITLAQERGWLVSGGSDFHGSMKPYIEMGSSWVDEKTFLAIFQPSSE